MIKQEKFEKGKYFVLDEDNIWKEQAIPENTVLMTLDQFKSLQKDNILMNYMFELGLEDKKVYKLALAKYKIYNNKQGD